MAETTTTSLEQQVATTTTAPAYEVKFEANLLIPFVLGPFGVVVVAADQLAVGIPLTTWN